MVYTRFACHSRTRRDLSRRAAPTAPRRASPSAATCSISAPTPAWGDVDSPAVRFRPDHWLLVEGGRIVARAGRRRPAKAGSVHDHAGRLVLPGFIDTHVHSPQIDVIASYGTELLDWLTTHTFPAEARYADAAHAEAAAAHFLDALLAHGTTSAVVFPTVHAGSVDALFAAAEARGMRVIAGKVLMDRNAPADLRRRRRHAERDMEALIARWHGRARLAYAVTVRFAPTSSREQLAMAGAPVPRRSGALHADARRREPRRGALGARAVPGGAQLPRRLRARSACCTRRACSRTASGSTTPTAPRSPRPARRSRTRRRRTCSSAAACSTGAPPRPPASHVSLASDVGGGTSLSMLRNMADAYKIQALAGERLTAWKALHAATRGAAQRARPRRARSARSTPARTADVCVWDARGRRGGDAPRRGGAHLA